MVCRSSTVSSPRGWFPGQSESADARRIHCRASGSTQQSGTNHLGVTRLRAKPSVESAEGRIETRFGGQLVQFLVSIRRFAPTQPANCVTPAIVPVTHDVEVASQAGRPCPVDGRRVRAGGGAVGPGRDVAGHPACGRVGARPAWKRGPAGVAGRGPGPTRPALRRFSWMVSNEKDCKHST